MEESNKIIDKRIFVTGGAGFIASHLIEKLIENNKIVVYDNFSRNALQYTNLSNHPNLKVIKGDVLDSDHLQKAMQGSDVCIHAAAVAGIYTVGVDPTHTVKVIIFGTYNTLEAAVINKVRRFVDFSTSEVYGPFVYKGKETDVTTIGPVGERRWVYAVSKLAAEHLASTYEDKNDIEVITVRPFNIYGPRQVGEGAIHNMVKRALNNDDIVIYNDGNQIRAWCYIDDFISGMYSILLMTNSKSHVFNLGNPKGTITVLGLAERIIRLSGSKSKIIFKPHPGPEVEMRIPDISKAESMLRFSPKIGLEEGLEMSIEWYRNHLDV
jgi:UDP-glucose 4-epimerase